MQRPALKSIPSLPPQHFCGPRPPWGSRALGTTAAEALTVQNHRVCLQTRISRSSRGLSGVHPASPRLADEKRLQELSRPEHPLSVKSPTGPPWTSSFHPPNCENETVIQFTDEVPRKAARDLPVSSQSTSNRSTGQKPRPELEELKGGTYCPQAKEQLRTPSPRATAHVLAARG